MAEATYGSPEWWLDQLYKRLAGRSPRIVKAERYYDGTQELKYLSEKYRSAFAEMLRGVCDNWMALVVDAVEERLHVEGFRIGDNTVVDKDAELLWQQNHLDADSELLHRVAIATGHAYAMVWPAGEGSVDITVEHPLEVFVAYQGGSNRSRAAAVKCWHDEWTSKLFANVYLPAGIHKFESAASDDVVRGGTPPTWKRRRDGDFVENPYGVIPIVEFRNRPRMDATGVSEIQDVMSTQDQINKLVCDMLIASEFAAFRQRWAPGLEVEIDDETGKPIEPFQLAMDRLLTTADADVKFGEFSATDLKNYIGAIENRVQSIASRTRTPPHYLLGNSGSFPSGESLKATETGLVAKVRSKQRHFGESWEEVMRLAGRMTDNDAIADAAKAETKWQDPESRTEAEHIDALVKLRSLNVPLQQLWEDAKYTPQQIDRFRQMLLDEAMYQLLAAPAPTGA